MDFSSWQSVMATVLGMALFALIGIGIRLLMMVTIQQRRERMNRQINERLRTLIAAYKVLGGSFTGNLAVDPRHLQDLKRRREPSRGEVPADSAAQGEEEEPLDLSAGSAPGSDRTRRIRDAVEASLSDIILLGTEQQVRLAGRAADELVAGRPVHTHELVVSLRDFIREALDLDPMPPDILIPMQGPARPSNGGGRGGGARGQEGGRQGGGGGGGGGAGGGGGGGGAGGMGMAGGMGAGLGMSAADGSQSDQR